MKKYVLIVGVLALVSCRSPHPAIHGVSHALLPGYSTAATLHDGKAVAAAQVRASLQARGADPAAIQNAIDLVGLWEAMKAKNWKLAGAIIWDGIKGSGWVLAAVEIEDQLNDDDEKSVTYAPQPGMRYIQQGDYSEASIHARSCSQFHVVQGRGSKFKCSESGFHGDK